MATTRTAALVGTDIILQAEFRQPVTGKLFDPTSISSVRILDTDGVTILQTITGSNIVRVQTGIYEVVGKAVNYDVAGVYFDQWTAVLETGQSASAYTLETMVLNTVAATSYCTVQDMRDEGYSSSVYPDDRVARAATLATRYIDVMTGRWFSPRYFSEDQPFVMDGSGTYVLNLPIPVIEIQKIKVSSGIDGVTLYEVDASYIRLYNRHLRGQTTGTMDDREDPRIELLGDVRRVQRIYDDYVKAWPEGSGNVQLVGYFGYTDYDPGNVRGQTPLLIKHACKLLTEMELAQFQKRSQRDTLRHRHRVIGQETKDQSVTLDRMMARGLFTGNQEIDNILTAYRRPPHVGSA